MAAYASVIAFGVLVFVMGPSIIKSIRTIASITSGVSDLLWIIIGVGVIAIFTSMVVLASYLRKRLFPTGLFLIGDGVNRYQRIVRYRKGVVGATGFAVTAILTAYISSLFR